MAFHVHGLPCRAYLVHRLRNGVYVKPERAGAESIGELAALQAILKRHRVAAVQPTGATMANLFGRGHKTKALPRVAALAGQRIDHAEDFAARPNRRLGDRVGVVHRHVVFVIAHEGVEMRMHPEHRRVAIRRMNAHALHFV